jgi:hypothetical protein
MVNRKEDHYQPAGAVDELELERQRERDPLRPLVLVLLDIARRQLREEKERAQEGASLPEDDSNAQP